MKIGGLQKLTLIDYPDKLACTVFLCGCNFRCPSCYSSELVLPEKQEKLPEVSEKSFFDFLKERKGQLEGVTICGGEPTINPELPRFCKAIKRLGYKVKLDTNGSHPQVLKDLIEKSLVDYVAMDVKAPKRKYPKVIGFQECTANYLLNNIEKSIELLKKSNIDYEFRTTATPLLRKDDILKIAQWLKPAKRYVLQNFRPEKTVDPSFENRKPRPDEFLLAIQKAIAPFFDICQVR